MEKLRETLETVQRVRKAGQQIQEVTELVSDALDNVQRAVSTVKEQYPKIKDKCASIVATVFGAQTTPQPQPARGPKLLPRGGQP